MLEWIKGRFDRGKNTPWNPPQPQESIYVVGDIHGEIQLLERLLAKMGSDHHIVFVGDYVDRGPHSAAVLRCLFALDMDPTRSITCLLGNHEEMMMGFLKNPVANAMWLRHGGRNTLTSLGVAPVPERADEPILLDTRDQLANALGGDIRKWLGKLPRLYQTGNLAVVHAGTNPKLSMKKQKSDRLIWGHPDFGKISRRDGVWVAHGHTVVEDPVALNGIISVDTGAYATGRLTAAFISPGTVEFISA